MSETLKLVQTYYAPSYTFPWAAFEYSKYYEA